ncbi:MAG TPA: hypothetical protein VJU86_05095 [Pyrinomonadaceae bacterium]|nr:hypothetical protein [Pyrinomonadaceae bacterium]
MFRKISVLVVLSLAIVVTHDWPGSAQNVVTGTWTASVVGAKAKLNLNLDQDGKKKHQVGQSFDFADLQGLTLDQAKSGGPVRFSLVREAGTIECEGSFENGKGSGTFRFTASQGYVSAMKSRGFDFEKDPPSTEEGRLEDRLLTATVLNVTTAQADDLLSANFGKLGVPDLFKANIFKVDSKFMREMKASGFPNLGMEELVKARIFKIDAQFVTEATKMGFEKEPFESLVKMQIFKVTPEFVAEVRNEGLKNLSIEQAVKLRIFKIDAEFIRQAVADGVPMEVERLVQRKLGVDRRRQTAL